MILIIDNYDSFTYNLAHLVARAASAYRVVRNDEVTIEEVAAMRPDGIMISPGPGRPAAAGISVEVVRAFGATTPLFGVCLGHQAIGEAFGGRVTYAPELMHGKTSKIRHDGDGIFRGVEQGFTATRYHSLVLELDSLPEVLLPTAWAEDGTLMGLRHRSLPIDGVQFHPESVLTKAGPRIVGNWLQRVHETRSGDNGARDHTPLTTTRITS